VLCSLAPDGKAGSVIEIDYLTKNAAIADLERALKRYGLHEPSSSETKTILIVDDDPAFLQVYDSIIRRHLPGCRVVHAQDGQRALEAINHECPDLVLLDLLMPTMDGFQVLEVMRLTEATRSIPVIVLTSQTLTESDIARLNKGVGAILGKGLFSQRETLAHIEAALSRGASAGQEAQQFVRRAMAYVHTHFAESISCSDLAKYLHINQDYLIRCFRQELGITPGTYLVRWRIKQAKELLENTDKGVTAIALDVGFSSQSYFSRVFKDQVGISPTAFRRTSQEPRVPTAPG
jgi:YesN/AraC family two-component response regulator